MQDVSSILKSYLAHFLSQAQKIKKIHFAKICYIFSKKVFSLQEMQLSSPKIKKDIFSQKKLFIFFRKCNFLKKLILFQEGTFQAQKIIKNASLKKFLIFQEIQFSSPKLKNSYVFYKKISYIFRRELAKLGKQKFLLFLQKGSLAFWDKH